MSEKHGNGAKMREALKFLIKHKEWLRGHNLTMTLEDLETIDRILGKADAALAAPRKNCERFQTWDEAKDAYWREQGDPCDWRKLGAWLFAPEGGAK